MAMTNNQMMSLKKSAAVTCLFGLAFNFTINMFRYNVWGGLIGHHANYLYSRVSNFQWMHDVIKCTHI
ncbi:hypothetical protein HanHA300_Chr04g0152201 [Helianthus annuus]|nr:hypothetical protein HanHA300_Chr04g0152201 [Helianthus annuus]KAJ0590675.1 hypothetical protein HanIR_Chr04g0200121 [Helianthus annuus]KAJ0598416.1 hypothetical protein HanHA89_Chr04g0165571 [Helianthus annuus]